MGFFEPSVIGGHEGPHRNFRKFRVLPDKLVAMVTPDNIGNQK